MKQHELKCWPDWFQMILEGKKRFEIRRNDRDFRIGDVLLLNEYRNSVDHPGDSGYTGRSLCVSVTSILHEHDGLKHGFVIMGIADANG